MCCFELRLTGRKQDNTPIEQNGAQFTVDAGDNEVLEGNAEDSEVSEEVIDTLAQQVSDTFSIRKSLTKYQSIERKKAVEKDGNDMARARSYSRPAVVSR